MFVMLRIIASNAAANIISGFIAAAYQVTITSLASRTWNGSEFTVWALALSIAAIAPLFAVNLASVVTRRIVEFRCEEKSELAIVLAGRRVSNHLHYAALIFLISSGVWIEAGAGARLNSGASFLILLLMVLMSNTWIVTWQTRFGQYYAEEKYWPPALTLASARVGGALGMVGGLTFAHNNTTVAGFGLLTGTWFGLTTAYFLLPKPSLIESRGADLTPLEINRQYRSTAQLLSGFAVGSISMLAVQYGIPPFIALIAPELFNAFYIASIMNMVAIGVLAASMGAMLAQLTRWHSTDKTTHLQRFTLLSPILCSGTSLALLSLCWYAIGYIHDAFVLRAAKLEDVESFFALLGFQTIIRSAAAGYATYVASAGSSRQIATPLIIEIVLALTFAVPLGWFFGERAAIYGLILSGLVGSQFSGQFVASLQRTNYILPGGASISLLGAQLATSGIWWLIVYSAM